jgi:hypothetical protein
VRCGFAAPPYGCVKNGGPMVDLNTLIPPNSPLLLEEGGNINDRGEIAGRGVPPWCDDVDACGHAFLLIPCANDAICESSGNVVTAGSHQPSTVMKTKSTTSLRTLPQILTTWRTRLAEGRTTP